jgi:hypothetical protein
VNPDRLRRGDGGEFLLLTQAPHVGRDSASKPMLASSDTALPHGSTLGGWGAMPLRLVGRTPLEARRSGAYLWIMVAPSENLASSWPPPCGGESSQRLASANTADSSSSNVAIARRCHAWLPAPHCHRSSVTFGCWTE